MGNGVAVVALAAGHFVCPAAFSPLCCVSYFSVFVVLICI